MRIRYFAMVLTTFMLGIFLGTGCSTSNEGAIGPTPVVPQKEGVPALSGYADAVKYMEQQQKAKSAEAKGAGKKP
jgi:hypothetical protein